jgi:hypothetical protein
VRAHDGPVAGRLGHRVTLGVRFSLLWIIFCPRLLRALLISVQSQLVDVMLHTGLPRLLPFTVDVRLA